MTRSIELTRDEAEALVDLVLLSNDGRLLQLGSDIRELFGMVSSEEQLAKMGLTLEQFRAQYRENTA